MSVRPVFDDSGAGIDATFAHTTGEYRVVVVGSTVRNENLSDNIPIAIYDTIGRLIYHGTNHSVTINNCGFYIIKVNNQTQKFVVS